MNYDVKPKRSLERVSRFNNFDDMEFVYKGERNGIAILEYYDLRSSGISNLLSIPSYKFAPMRGKEIYKGSDLRPLLNANRDVRKNEDTMTLGEMCLNYKGIIGKSLDAEEICPTYYVFGFSSQRGKNNKKLIVSKEFMDFAGYDGISRHDSINAKSVADAFLKNDFGESERIAGILASINEKDKGHKSLELADNPELTDNENPPKSQPE